MGPKFWGDDIKQEFQDDDAIAPHPGTVPPGISEPQTWKERFGVFSLGMLRKS